MSEYEEIIQKLQSDPRKSLEAARRGSINDLTELANFWQEAPGLLSMGILDVFYTHLDADKAPTTHDPATSMSATANRAFIALLGLSKAGTFIGEEDVYARSIINAWPGIFKWCSLFFAVRVRPPAQRPEVRRSTMDVIAGALYAISRNDDTRKTIIDTPGSLEMTAQLWLLEDVIPIPSTAEIPVCTAALHYLLRMSEPPTHDRLLKAAGGKPQQVAKLALTRLHTESQKPSIHGYRTAVYADILSSMSCHPNHPLRNALLIANAISTVSKALVSVSTQLNATGNPMLLDAMVSLFGYLRNCLESTDGFTWISQSVQAGFLTAFVECSPHFSKVDLEDRTMILSIMKDILPRYLVYRSVIQTIAKTLDVVLAPNKTDKVSKSIANDVWKNFVALVEERIAVSLHAAAWKGKVTVCDNANCLKVESKNNFSKCGGCGTTFYCSKECQTAAWKEGDHKTVCKLKQRERLEGKKQGISKGDKSFLHHLSIRDARRHLPHLRSLAAREYPDTPFKGLVIHIDYMRLPEKYSVVPVDKYNGLKTAGSANAEARNDALFEKVRDNQDKYTLLESVIAYGEDGQLVMTLCKSFWENDAGLLGGGDGRVEGEAEYSDDDDDQDSLPKPALDEVDDLMKGMSLNQLMDKSGRS